MHSAAHSSSLALVLNFHHQQLNDMIRNIKYWDTMRPRKHSDGKRRVHVVFYVDVDDKHQVEPMRKTIEVAWQRDASQAVRGMFDGAAFEVVHYNGLNQYPDVPCEKLFDTWSMLNRIGRFGAFFNMEPDCTPIRSGWVDRLLEESVVSEKDEIAGDAFWQKGSTVRCHESAGNGRNQLDFHFNGASLYRVGTRNEEFEQYRKRVREFYPSDGQGRAAGCHGFNRQHNFKFDGDDLCLYWYRRDPDNYAYVRTVEQHFLTRHFVSNMCKDDFSPTEYAEKHPGVYLVHGNAAI